MVRVAVTGATGFIGRHLVASLVAHGHDVRAVLRTDTTAAEPAGASVVRSALDTASLTTAFEHTDVVVHLAGVVAATRASQFEAANVTATRAVAEACAAVGARLVHVSSLAAVGPAPASLPRHEDDEPAPLTPYGRSKLRGEQVVAAVTGLNWLLIRPAAVYGPGDRAMLPLFRLAGGLMLPLVGPPDAAYTFVHVRDVVRALEAAVQTPRAREAIFVGHPRPVTTGELLQQVRTAVNGRSVIFPIPSLAIKAAAALCDGLGAVSGHVFPLNGARAAEIYAPGFVCSVERMRDHLGVTADVSFRDGLAETAAWYRAQGWIPRR